MKQKKCFVIGPMNKEHIKSLRWLANDVVKKILSKRDFYVFTPDVSETGNIMNHVIRSADRADLVIADITGNNPNVLYEIGLLNSMGRSCIPVKIIEKSHEKEDLPPFDIAQYRFFPVVRGDTPKAIKELEPVIINVLDSQEKGEIPSNPITDFFGVALSALSSAHGLSRGYYRNFVLYAIKGEVEEGPDQFIGAKGLDLHIIVSDKLIYSTRWAVGQLENYGYIVPVVLQAPGRKVNAFVWSENISKTPILVDVPTALGQLRDNVLARLGKLASTDPTSAEFLELEEDEIRQFKRYLQGFIDREHEFPVGYKAKIYDVSKSIYPELFDRLK